MIIIKIPYLGATNIAARRAIEMSNWCKENGLVHSKHFDWSFRHQLKEIHFRFYSDDESLATMFALIWNR
jgi:hypothetical protein